MLYGSVSSKTIIAKVVRDLRLQSADEWLSMVEWIGEAIAFIGAFDQFENKVLYGVEVTNKRVAMPCDLYSIIQISKGGAPLTYLGGSFDFSFHVPGSVNLKTRSAFGYTVNGPWLNLNFNTTTIDIAYQAFATDEDGWPLVPDEVSYKEACFRYIVMKMKYADYLAGRVTETKWNVIDRDWQFYCGQARGVANMPNIDQMEAISKFWVNLVPNIRGHDSFFNDMGLSGGSRGITGISGSETVTAIG